MPNPPTFPASSISAQTKSQLLKGIHQSVEAHAAIDACMKDVEGLLQQAIVAVREHHANVTALVKQRRPASPETKVLEEIRDLQRAFNAQYLQLHSQMQHESSKFTAESNVLKTRLDTVRNSIANIR